MEAQTLVEKETQRETGRRALARTSRVWAQLCTGSSRLGPGETWTLILTPRGSTVHSGWLHGSELGCNDQREFKFHPPYILEVYDIELLN